MEKSQFEQLAELAKKYFKYPDLNKIATKTVYQNLKDESDTFTNPDEFITRKLNGADYKKVVLLSSPKDDFLKEFFGTDEYKITKDVKSDMHVIKLVFAAAGLITTNAMNPEQVNATSTPEKPKKEKTPFQKATAAAQAKIQNVKGGKNKSVTLEQAQAELLSIYEKFGEVYKPRDAKTNL